MRLDLHTHTYVSGDSSTTFDEYREAFLKSGIDIVAVTDHLTVDGALQLRQMLPNRVIVGQEFRCDLGEVIGLYLEESIPPLLTFAAAIDRIRDQGGLVMIPHPNDLVRVSIDLEEVEDFARRGFIDIIEAGNSKSKPDGTCKGARAFAERFSIPMVSNSDAHVEGAIGSSFTETDSGVDCSDPESLLEALKSSNCKISYFDPPRRWRSRVVPSSTNSSFKCL
ncbi:MAG: PHP domain-containing protein [Actinomycetota bacterium]|nr:PHP domain-containing protein [Actinomycetota bacterium]